MAVLYILCTVFIFMLFVFVVVSLPVERYRVTIFVP